MSDHATKPDDTRPVRPFTFAARGRSAQPVPDPKDKAIKHEKIRDQDNAQPRVKPPGGASKPAPSLAPPGMAGIKRRDPNAPPRQIPKTPFKPNGPGSLAKEFKPIAEPTQEKGWER